MSFEELIIYLFKGAMRESLLLDDDLENNISKLSDYQLIGITITKVKYPTEIINLVEFEIQRRKLNPIKINELKAKYLSEEIVENIPITKLQIVCIILAIGFVISTISFTELISLSILSGILKFTILFAPIIAIQARFQKGLLAEKNIWKAVNIIAILLIISCILVSYTVL